MTTLYVAGPMTGLPEFNYPAFREAGEQLTAAGFTVLNPIDVDTTGTTEDERTWQWFMRRTLKMMLDADAIATLPGWRQSKGASIEVDTADRIFIGEAPVTDWLAYGDQATRDADEAVHHAPAVTP